ncbi:MAG: hypothetical protein LBN27_14065 [Prevotellaceae bacterium]|jgi:hypothetical protein|nr:hypothetical protein [Prevotellaceae bacterium]
MKITGGKYIEYWQSNLDLIVSKLKLAHQTVQYIQLKETDFKALGNRKSYTFNLEYSNGNVNNNIKSSAVARDLQTVLDNSDKAKMLLNSACYVLKLDEKYVLSIQHFKTIAICTGCHTKLYIPIGGKVECPHCSQNSNLWDKYSRYKDDYKKKYNSNPGCWIAFIVIFVIVMIGTCISDMNTPNSEKYERYNRQQQERYERKREEQERKELEEMRRELLYQYHKNNPEE